MRRAIQNILLKQLDIASVWSMAEKQRAYLVRHPYGRTKFVRKAN
jgi:hypothetical protein